VLNWATDLQFSVVERTKLVTAASELARNTLVHGGGGAMAMSVVENDGRSGLRLEFSDEGPGIADIEQALVDGYSTAGSMGRGLGGSRRLVHEFAIESQPARGTRVTITQWKRR